MVSGFKQGEMSTAVYSRKTKIHRVSYSRLLSYISSLTSVQWSGAQ